jgi:hypothetical protein
MLCAQTVPALGDSAWVVEYVTRVNGDGHFQVLEWGLPPGKVVWLSGSVSVTRFPQPRHQLNSIWVDYSVPEAYYVSDSAQRIEQRHLNDIGPNALSLAAKVYKRVRGADSVCTLLGYRCRVYEAQVDMPEVGGPVKIRLAIAPALAMPHGYCSELAADTAMVERALLAGCMGYPLRRQLTLEGLGAVITEEATRVRKMGRNGPPAEWPVWPQAYSVVPFDPARSVPGR